MYLAMVCSTPNIVKLIAAFDHRHIFLDPDPDPEISYQERFRLFNFQLLPGMITIHRNCYPRRRRF